MVIVWFAAGAILLIAAIWAASVRVMKSKGGALPVDNDRDINDRYFAEVLRDLLRPALASDWGEPGAGGWVVGNIAMRRQGERIALYRGDLRLERMEQKVAALVVAGDLTIADGLRLDCDIWALGDVTVGSNCTLRALAADGSVTLGPRSVVNRWVDAGRTLHLRAGATVVNTASAGEDVVLENGFRGGKLAGRVVRITAVDVEARAAACEQLAVYQSLRDRYGSPPGTPNPQSAGDWILPHSACTDGRFWTGPGTVMLHDLIVRSQLQLGEGSIIAGDLHVEGECTMAPRAMVTGNLACGRLTMGAGAVVGGSIHVDGDAIVGEGVMIGLLSPTAGLAVTGSVQMHEKAVVGGRVSAAEILYSGPVRRKAG